MKRKRNRQDVEEWRRRYIYRQADLTVAINEALNECGLTDREVDEQLAPEDPEIEKIRRGDFEPTLQLVARVEALSGKTILNSTLDQ